MKKREADLRKTKHDSHEVTKSLLIKHELLGELK